MTPAEIWGLLVSTVKTVGSVFKAGRWFYGKLRKPRIDHVAVLKRREDLRNEFLRRLPREDEQGVRGEAIIRDIERMDSYPELDARGKGTSPWFKVEVKGVYHRGLEVFIGVPHRIKKDMYGEWKFTQYNDDDSMLAYAVGRIPFDVIQHVDWGGDEYYRHPHIYCRFDAFKNQPYEEIAFFAKIHGTEHLYEVKDFRPWDKKTGFWFLKVVR